MTAERDKPSSAGPPSTYYEAAWDRLAAAADDRGHPMRLHSFATIDADGGPDSRILILRGARRETARLWYHTDVRSRKVAQLAADHRACALCYDPGDGTQMRISGTVAVHCDDELARRHWEQFDHSVRWAYALPSVAGDPLAHPDFRMRDHADRVHARDPDRGRASFAVLELTVAALEWLQVSDTGDERVVMRAARGWATEH